MLNILWWSHNVDLICYDKLNDKLDNELKIKAYKKIYMNNRQITICHNKLEDKLKNK